MPAAEPHRPGRPAPPDMSFAGAVAGGGPVRAFLPAGRWASGGRPTHPRGTPGASPAPMAPVGASGMNPFTLTCMETPGMSPLMPAPPMSLPEAPSRPGADVRGRTAQAGPC